MKIKVHEVKYEPENLELATGYDFDISDEISSDDQLLANEVTRLIKEITGADIESCSVDVDL